MYQFCPVSFVQKVDKTGAEYADKLTLLDILGKV